MWLRLQFCTVDRGMYSGLLRMGYRLGCNNGFANMLQPFEEGGQIRGSKDRCYLHPATSLGELGIICLMPVR